MLSIEEIKKASLDSGSPFFLDESMATFKSVIYDEVYPGNYFITSEVMPGESESSRQWKIRQWKSGRIKTKPQYFPSLKSAKDYLKAII